METSVYNVERSKVWASNCRKQTNSSESTPDRIEEGRKHSVAHVNGSCEADFLSLVEFHSLCEYVTLLPFDLAEDFVIEGDHGRR